MTRSTHPTTPRAEAPPAFASAQVIASATSAPIASWPSSIRRPTSVDQMPLNISRFDLRALRNERSQGPHGEPTRGQERYDDQRNRKRVTGPLHPQRFGEPEDAEAAE